jgi:hypothetical protein
MTDPNPKPTNASITGRDAYIMAQALFQACQWQERLKEQGSHFYEWSNHQDMKALLTSEPFIAFAGVFSMQCTHMGEKMPDLENEKELEFDATSTA